MEDEGGGQGKEEGSRYLSRKWQAHAQLLLPQLRPRLTTFIRANEKVSRIPAVLRDPALSCASYGSLHKKWPDSKTGGIETLPSANGMWTCCASSHPKQSATSSPKERNICESESELCPLDSHSPARTAVFGMITMDISKTPQECQALRRQSLDFVSPLAAESSPRQAKESMLRVDGRDSAATRDFSAYGGWRMWGELELRPETEVTSWGKLLRIASQKHWIGPF